MSWEELGNRFSGLLAFGSDLCSLQLVQDILDYESASATLSKPGGADLVSALPQDMHSAPGRSIR